MHVARYSHLTACNVFDYCNLLQTKCIRLISYCDKCKYKIVNRASTRPHYKLRNRSMIYSAKHIYVTSCFIHSHVTQVPIRHEVVVPYEHDSPTSIYAS